MADHGRLIDADALIAKYGNWYTEEGPEEGFIGTIKNLVDTMPTIERKKGRWILRNADSGFHTDCICSECKSRHAIGWDFCPNCGADMRAEVARVR